MFQYRFVKRDEFGWWGLEINSEDAGTQFTSTEFRDEYQTCGAHLTLAAPEHQEMNAKVKVTCITLHTISHSRMVHSRVLEAYIHHIFLVLIIQDLINKDDEPTTPFKLVTGTKPSVSHLRMLFFHVLYGI